MLVVYDSRNEQTASASRDNETISLTEPVTFRFRDFKFAQRRRRVVVYLELYDNLHSVDFCTLPKRRRLRRDYKLRGSPPLAYGRNVSSDAGNLTKFDTESTPFPPRLINSISGFKQRCSPHIECPPYGRSTCDINIL